MKIVAFTGAGMSRESGLLTFRDSKDGLWEGHDVQAVASIQGWWRDPQRVLDFYNTRRRDLKAAQPNAGHFLIADLERHHDVTVITQNVDDLHERAGSTHVIHLHGELFKARPDNDEAHRHVVTWKEDINLGTVDDQGIQMRPHIVWFGEGLPMLEPAMQIGLAKDVDVLIVVGTTLEVYPAAMIATETQASLVFLVDPSPPTLRVPHLTVFSEPATTGLRKVKNLLS